MNLLQQIVYADFVVKTRSPDQTAICISISKELLAQIDARAGSLNLPRSQYLALLALDDVVRGGPLAIPAAPPPNPIDLERETYEFLLVAIPALDRLADPAPEPPENIDPKFWAFFLRERKEILDYKWIQSQKEGRDIGMERAIREWLQKHFALWATAQSTGRLAFVQ